MGFELNYCGVCKVQLAPDDFDGICSGCDQEEDVVAIAEKFVIYNCTICQGFHPWNWSSDCRDNDNRYASAEEYAKAVGRPVEEVEVRSMCERLEADGGTPHQEAVNINENRECKHCGKEIA